MNADIDIRPPQDTDGPAAHQLIADIRRVTATITEDNAASWALFKSLAKSLECGYESRETFRSDEHFAGAHATESLIAISPFLPLQQTVDA